MQTVFGVLTAPGYAPPFLGSRESHTFSGTSLNCQGAEEAGICGVAVLTFWGFSLIKDV